MKSKNSRREFLTKTALTAIAIPFLGTSLLGCNSKTKPKTIATKGKKLKILILGGTSFLGPHQIKYALDRGHQVSIFTRGKTKPKFYPKIFENVEHLIGDRENNLTALEKRKWDIVIDNSGRKVKWTEDTANLLKDNCNLYMYTSSTGVYYPYLESLISTKTPLVLELPEGLTEDEKYEHDYGIMKAKSEIAVQNAFGKDRTTVIRPTYMIGPGDRTDRFLHWPIRLEKGGDVLVTGKQEDLVQYIDIRDVAKWFITLAEEKTAGVFNAVGPREKQTISEFVNKASQVFNNTSNFIYINDYDFLIKNNIFFQIPWVVPNKEHYGSARITNSKSIKSGLTFRTLSETIKDTLSWYNSYNFDEKRKENYLNDTNNLLNKEKKLLQKWKAIQKVS